MPVPFLRSGGAEGIRTPDLLTASQARSQLRHSPRNADELKVLRLRTGTDSPLSSTLLYPAGARIVKGKIPGAARQSLLLSLSVLCPLSSAQLPSHLGSRLSVLASPFLRFPVSPLRHLSLPRRASRTMSHQP